MDINAKLKQRLEVFDKIDKLAYKNFRMKNNSIIDSYNYNTGKTFSFPKEIQKKSKSKKASSSNKHINKYRSILSYKGTPIVSPFGRSEFSIVEGDNENKLNKFIEGKINSPINELISTNNYTNPTTCKSPKINNASSQNKNIDPNHNIIQNFYQDFYNQKYQQLYDFDNQFFFANFKKENIDSYNTLRQKFNFKKFNNSISSIKKNHHENSSSILRTTKKHKDFHSQNNSFNQNKTRFYSESINKYFHFNKLYTDWAKYANKLNIKRIEIEEERINRTTPEITYKAKKIIRDPNLFHCRLYPYHKIDSNDYANDYHFYKNYSHNKNLDFSTIKGLNNNSRIINNNSLNNSISSVNVKILENIKKLEGIDDIKTFKIYRTTKNNKFHPRNSENKKINNNFNSSFTFSPSLNQKSLSMAEKLEVAKIRLIKPRKNYSSASIKCLKNPTNLNINENNSGNENEKKFSNSFDEYLTKSYNPNKNFFKKIDYKKIIYVQVDEKTKIPARTIDLYRRGLETLKKKKAKTIEKVLNDSELYKLFPYQPRLNKKNFPTVYRGKINNSTLSNPSKVEARKSSNIIEKANNFEIDISGEILNIYDKQMIWKNNIERKTKKLKYEAEIRENKFYTFKPDILKDEMPNDEKFIEKNLNQIQDYVNKRRAHIQKTIDYEKYKEKKLNFSINAKKFIKKPTIPKEFCLSKNKSFEKLNKNNYYKSINNKNSNKDNISKEEIMPFTSHYYRNPTIINRQSSNIINSREKFKIKDFFDIEELKEINNYNFINSKPYSENNASHIAKNINNNLNSTNQYDSVNNIPPNLLISRNPNHENDFISNNSNINENDQKFNSIYNNQDLENFAENKIYSTQNINSFKSDPNSANNYIFNTDSPSKNQYQNNFDNYLSPNKIRNTNNVNFAFHNNLNSMTFNNFEEYYENNLRNNPCSNNNSMYNTLNSKRSSSKKIILPSNQDIHNYKKTFSFNIKIFNLLALENQKQNNIKSHRNTNTNYNISEQKSISKNNFNFSNHSNFNKSSKKNMNSTNLNINVADNSAFLGEEKKISQKIFTNINKNLVRNLDEEMNFNKENNINHLKNNSNFSKNDESKKILYIEDHFFDKNKFINAVKNIHDNLINMKI